MPRYREGRKNPLSSAPARATLVPVRSVTLALVLLTPQAAFSWGDEGHRAVVRLSEGLLTPAARARIEATLAPGESLSALASWADEIRRERRDTESWHYVDIPLHSSGFDWKRDCAATGCVVEEIEEFRRTWHNPALSRGARREALLFLVHFVGDMHQPLHCANHDDRGGNDVMVLFFGQPMRLHALWDFGLLNRMPAEDELLRKLVDAMTPEHVAEWSRGSVEDWANESHQAAEDTVYGPLPPVETGGVAQIGDRYLQLAEPVVELQIERAAARLAFILNEGAADGQ